MTGILKGYDPLVNIVIDDAVEVIPLVGSNSNETETRKLGLVICRGTNVTVVSPVEDIPSV